MSKKTAVIIGGSGGIGTAISQKMLQKDIKVYSSYFKQKPKSSNINYFEIEITDIDSVRSAFSKILTEQNIDFFSNYLRPGGECQGKAAAGLP